MRLGTSMIDNPRGCEHGDWRDMGMWNQLWMFTLLISPCNLMLTSFQYQRNPKSSFLVTTPWHQYKQTPLVSDTVGNRMLVKELAQYTCGELLTMLNTIVRCDNQLHSRYNSSQPYMSWESKLWMMNDDLFQVGEGELQDSLPKSHWCNNITMSSHCLMHRILVAWRVVVLHT